MSIKIQNQLDAHDLRLAQLESMVNEHHEQLAALTHLVADPSDSPLHQRLLELEKLMRRAMGGKPGGKIES